MVSHTRRRARLAMLAPLLAAAVVISGCGSGGVAPGHSTSTTTASGAPQQGGEVSFALPPGNSPQMILPFFSGLYVGSANISDFIDLMYRPLYFLTGETFALNEEKSLAAPPVYNASRTAVTVTLKHWKWSDGEAISPKDIAFFIALVKTETPNWWGDVPNAFPSNLKYASYDNSADSFTLHLTHPVNPDWFTYNQLPLLTPMPMAWDITAPGKPGNCTDEDPSAEAKACPRVYAYLEKQAKDTSTYDTNKLWQIVDGPWRLKTYSSGGSSVILVPNQQYSGSDKPHISEFHEEAFTSEAAEYNVLRSGNSLTVGYLPAVDAPAKPANAAVGGNPVSGYDLEPWFNWALDYINTNFDNPVTGPVVNQLYFRQALQMLVDEPTWIKDGYQGYAYPTYGGVPNEPKTPYLTSYVASDPYAFNVSKATQLITSHGWALHGSKPATCTRPGTASDDCGPGVKSGTKLSFSFIYPSGTASLANVVQDYQSDLARAGVQLILRAEPIDTMFATLAPCTAKQSSCSWGMVDFGGPDSYLPFWYPDNGLEFTCGAPANTGSFCDPALDKLYTSEVYEDPGLAALHTVENLETRDAAVTFIPVPFAQLTEVKADLGGYTQSGTMSITPEDWYLTKG